MQWKKGRLGNDQYQKWNDKREIYTAKELDEFLDFYMQGETELIEYTKNIITKYLGKGSSEG